MVDLDPDFRHWSIRAFCLESGIVILAFVIMVMVFRWPVTATIKDEFTNPESSSPER